MTHRRSVFPLLLITLMGLSLPVGAVDDWSVPFEGGALTHRVANGQDAWVLVVDLCQSGISVRTTRFEERGRVPSSFGQLVGAAAVVNGDFSNGYDTDGPARSMDSSWGGADHPYVAPIAFGLGRAEISHHNNTTGMADWMHQVVSGHPTILDDGTEVGNPGDPLCTVRHPRTSVGLSEDHRSLVLAVVDGRRSGAAGMTCPELAALMSEFGAFDAVNMDGGGSSAMWLANGGVKNQPSDGSQRSVGNHLGVLASGSGPAWHCPAPPTEPEPEDPPSQDPAPEDPAPEVSTPEDPAPEDLAPEDPTPDGPATQDPSSEQSDSNEVVAGEESTSLPPTVTQGCQTVVAGRDFLMFSILLLLVRRRRLFHPTR